VTPVLAEDADWLFLNKPAGLPIFPPHEDPSGPCLLESLTAARPDQEAGPWPRGFEGGLVHRLDTWTSGLVVAARTPEALASARELFAQRALRKHYLFLTDREVAWELNVVETSLAHARKDRRKMVWQRGKSTPHRGRWFPARTVLRRVGRWGDLGVWTATITTGVTHQIRVHAAAVGLALAGDRLYGGSSREQTGRFYLHAERIEGWPVPTPVVEHPTDWPER
jgi:23S rRNA pseudouridine1911/1915/1917 synthase